MSGLPRLGLRPEVAGFQVWGGRRLLIRNLKLTDTSQVTSHPSLKEKQPGQYIIWRNNELTVSDDVCMRIRSGATRISVLYNHFFDCHSGLTGPNDPTRSGFINIERNLMERFKSDAIQFGGWNDVLIAENAILHVKDPEGKIHNDGIQFTGASSRVMIRSNLIADSAQLLFVQPAFGPIRGLSVVNNLMHNARGYAIQVQGTPGLRFGNNTVWNSGYGGLIVRGGGGEYAVVSRDAVVNKNVLSGFATNGKAGVASLSQNVIRIKPLIRGDGNYIGTPRFANALVGDYRILSEPPIPGVGVDYAALGFDPLNPASVLLPRGTVAPVVPPAPPGATDRKPPKIFVRIRKMRPAKLRRTKRIVMRVGLSEPGVLRIRVSTRHRKRIYSVRAKQRFRAARRVTMKIRLNRKLVPDGRQHYTIRLQAVDTAGNRSNRKLRRLAAPRRSRR